MKLFCCSALLFLVTGLSMQAEAPSTGGVVRLRGYVVDPVGIHLSGASVQLTAEDHTVMGLMTDRYGMFTFRAPEGVYDVIVAYAGFEILHRKDVLFTKETVTTFALGLNKVANHDEPVGTGGSSDHLSVGEGEASVAGFLPAPASPFAVFRTSTPWEYGVLVEGGNGVTENRNGFHFLSAGVHVGKVLTAQKGSGALRGNFEFAGELFPFWQSYTPKFQRSSCFATPTAGTFAVGPGLYCSPLYTVGGTFSGITMTPIILRWNFTHGKKLMPWAQAAGGLLWTNHKYPAFGSSILNLNNDGPNADASVWNFTPQGGIGLHYFVRSDRSVDFSANAIHISSASLGDKNPGVNASVQFTLGYTWWKK